MGHITFNQEDARIRINTDPVQWPDGKNIPLPTPKCGFDGLGCQVLSTSNTLAPENESTKIGRCKLGEGSLVIYDYCHMTP